MSQLGKKKQSLVKWLMKKGVPLEEAKLIASRKYYHHDRVRRKWSNIPTEEMDDIQGF